MAERKYTHGLQIQSHQRTPVIAIGDMEIWDGADLSLLRDTLTVLIRKERRRAIGVDMSFVKYVPSGFFGMLFDWFEQGISIHLLRPQPRIRNMVWFRQFFVSRDNEFFMLKDNEALAPLPDEVDGEEWPTEWEEDADVMARPHAM